MEFAVALEDDDFGLGAFHDLFKERPDGIHDGGAVAVFPGAVLELMATGEVELGDPVERIAIEELRYVVAVVLCVVEDVGDIEQEPAVGLFGEAAEEVGQFPRPSSAICRTPNRLKHPNRNSPKARGCVVT